MRERARVHGASDSRFPPRARRARRTISTTPGSSAIRRISRPASGSASTSRMLTKITAALGGETPSPSPARVDETGTPTPTATSGASAPTGAVVSEAPEMTPSPPVKKKRGFWSRVFGLGKDSEDGKPEAETKAPKKKPGG